MSFIFDDEQLAFQESARRFSREKVAPLYQQRERDGFIDRALVKEMGALGFIAPEMPEDLGGMAASSLTSGIIAEAISHGDINVGYINILSSLNCKILASYASPELKQEWVTKVVSGDAICAIALTEPRGGSDAANLSLSARRDGNRYILKGEKSSISMADQADIVVVFARTGTAESGAHGVSAFLVPMNTPGVSTLRFTDLGSKAIGRSSIFFDDVVVPLENHLADEGKGFVQVMQGFDFSRALIGLQVIASAQASLDETWGYIQERQAFGAPISKNQGVTFPLAEGETMLEAIRQLCYRTLSLKDANLPHTSEAAMCKWLAPKTSVDVIHQCLITHGHYGWSLDMPHQQRMRDVMGLEIGDGTAQIMKMIISREKLRQAKS